MEEAVWGVLSVTELSKPVSNTIWTLISAASVSLMWFLFDKNTHDEEIIPRVTGLEQTTSTLSSNQARLTDFVEQQVQQQEEEQEQREYQTIVKAAREVEALEDIPAERRTVEQEIRLEEATRQLKSRGLK